MTASASTSWNLQTIPILDTSNSVLAEFSRTAASPVPTTASSQRQSTTFSYSTTTAAATACRRLGYFECSADRPGCCPVGYVCAAQDLCIFPYPSMKVDFVARCPGRDGYGACDEDVGGGCCPLLYACLNGGCMLTQKLTKSLSTWTETYYGAIAESSSVLGVATWVDSVYPTSVDVFVNRLQSIPIITSFGGTDSPENDISMIGGFSDGAIAGIIVSCLFAALMLFLGLFFFIRRRQQKRAKENDDSVEDHGKKHSALELAEKSDIHEADTERHKVEMSSNDPKNEAWELEDTSYIQELIPSHGVSEIDPDSPTKTDVHTTNVAISPLSESHKD